MSKHKSNVNPDHYKTAGREPQGRDLDHAIERQVYAQSVAKEKRHDPWDAAEELNAKEEGRQDAMKVGKRSSNQKKAAAGHNAGPSADAKRDPVVVGREPGHSPVRTKRTKPTDKSRSKTRGKLFN